VAFYRELIDLLNAAGITLAITLFHWDLPQKLEDQGGWLNRATVDAFEAYARFVFKEFAAEVGYWITFNEPWVTTFAGYWLGSMAPGRTDMNEALEATHHILLAHGRAVGAFRDLQIPAKIGITLELFLALPATDSEADQRAAEMINLSHHGWFADPIYKGEYPKAVCDAYVKHGFRLPPVEAGDMEIIHQPLDFLGLNYYNSDVWKYDANGWGPYEATKVPPEAEKFACHDWRPDGLYLLLCRLRDRYGCPTIIITENGHYADDFVNHRGEINDESRIEYIYQHLAACRRAINEGVKLAGYFVWSFLDDYEWGQFGRMGLVYVDFQTLERRVKRSGRWYSECISRRTFSLP
jgi:beta-glucosidase